jgi:hypothetical protein
MSNTTSTIMGKFGPMMQGSGDLATGLSNVANEISRIKKIIAKQGKQQSYLPELCKEKRQFQ